MPPGLGRVAGAQPIGSRDDYKIRITTVIGDIPRHAQLPDHLFYGNEGLASNMSAPFGKGLIFNVRSRDTRVDVEFGRTLDIENVSISAVHIDDYRRDVQMFWRKRFFG